MGSEGRSKAGVMGKKIEITVRSTETELYLVDEDDLTHAGYMEKLTKEWLEKNYHVAWECGASLSVDGDAQTELLEVTEVE